MLAKYQKQGMKTTREALEGQFKSGADLYLI